MLKKLIKKIFSAGEYWTCMRCGTTNRKADSKCKECGNRRPF